MLMILLGRARRMTYKTICRSPDRMTNPTPFFQDIPNFSPKTPTSRKLSPRETSVIGHPTRNKAFVFKDLTFKF